MLSSKNRAYLRGLANKQTAIFQIGKGGINSNMIRQIMDALEARELIKLTVLESAMMDTRATCQEICERTDAEPVQVVGNKFVIYKKVKGTSNHTIMMKLGILGGTFDPIHNGHLAIAEAALSHGMDKILFVPAGTPPHKNDTVASAEERLRMTQLATEGNGDFLVCEYEVHRTEPSYSVDTLRWLHAKYPNDELYFILGDDAYFLLDYWKDSEEVKMLCRFLVFTREAVTIPPPAISVPITPIDISSTQVRNMLAEGKPIEQVVPKGVANYIITHQIYSR